MLNVPNVCCEINSACYTTNNIALSLTLLAAFRGIIHTMLHSLAMAFLLFLHITAAWSLTQATVCTYM